MSLLPMASLAKVVTGPDMRSGEEAASFVRTFQQLLRHIGTSDGNMEDGSLRVDVNVSVRTDAPLVLPAMPAGALRSASRHLGLKTGRVSVLSTRKRSAL